LSFPRSIKSRAAAQPKIVAPATIPGTFYPIQRS
jgi:hypothetical protein